MPKQPNLLFVFGDQWRAHATGYAGDPNARTPVLDAFAAENLNCNTVISQCPVCSPWRGTLMTGQYPHQHGIFINDVPLAGEGTKLAEAYVGAGYRTGYIGKWHIDGRGRHQYTPPERRLGFQYWRGFECSHDYNNSWYYADSPERLTWEGYDAEAQTREAQRYLADHAAKAAAGDPEGDKPFALFLSWGPPHDPYQTAPEQFRAQFKPEDIILAPNVPADHADKARTILAGYYAHILALDTYFGELLDTLEAQGLAEDTIVIFTSDHGDMAGSHGLYHKQKPWDESNHVPWLMRFAKDRPGRSGVYDGTVSSVDIMPTLLGLCDVPIPSSVVGDNLAPCLLGQAPPSEKPVLLALHHCFHQWMPATGGREYRGLRGPRWTYVRSLIDGPWLLYDNIADPYQFQNRIADSSLKCLVAELDEMLDIRLAEIDDPFEPGLKMCHDWGYEVDEIGNPPIRN